MAKQSKNPSKLRRLWLNIGKLILDATKLCFGSLVLGAAIRGEICVKTAVCIVRVFSHKKRELIKWEKGFF